MDWHNKPESCREEGKRRLALVNQARIARRRAPQKQRHKALTDYARTKGISLTTIKHYLRVAQKALEEARAKGTEEIMAQVIALTPEYGVNRGSYRAFSPEALEHGKALYLTQKLLNISDVHKHVLNEAAIRGWKVGSEDALRYYLKQETTPSLRTLARKGFRRYQADCEVKILRDYSEIPPNFMWCGDHHIFDVFVNVGNQPRRPWITAWMDMASRSFMGWCISFQPSSQTIALALAHAICNKNDDNFPQHGLPTSVYIDNGKDYRCKQLSGEEVRIGRIDYPEIIDRFAALGIDPFYIDLEYDPDQEAWTKKRGQQNLLVKKIRVGGVFARLGVSQRFATAYHPWSKPIERAFRTVAQRFSRQLPGWCGSGHEQRPEKLNDEIKSGRLLTFPQFCERWYQWAVEYNCTAHHGHGMNGHTPTEVFLSGGPAEEIDPDLLSFALLKKEQVRVYNWGFKLAGREFEPSIPEGTPEESSLSTLIGNYVTLFYSSDLQIVRIYAQGRYVCDGRPARRHSFINQDDQGLEEKRRLQALQRKQNQAVLEGLKQSLVLPGPEPQPPALPAPHEEEQTTPALPLAQAVPRPTPPQPQMSLKLIPQSDAHRYDLILDMRAKGLELCEEDQRWEEEYRQTEEFKKAQRYWEQELKQRTYSHARGAQ